MDNRLAVELRTQELIAAKNRVESQVLAINGVNGIGVGVSSNRNRAVELQPQDLCIRVYFENRSAMSQASASLSQIFGQLPFEAEYIGPVRAL